MLISYAVQFEYKMYQNNDCLLINNLHSMGSDVTSDHNNWIGVTTTVAVEVFP